VISLFTGKEGGAGGEKGEEGRRERGMGEKEKENEGAGKREKAWKGSGEREGETAGEGETDKKALFRPVVTLSLVGGVSVLCGGRSSVVGWCGASWES